MGQRIIYNDDLNLLQNFREGDIHAFRYIYSSHYRPLFHFANRFIKDSQQAEDIIAECFISLWKKRKEFETFKGLIAFLYTCTRNGCISHLKKIKRHEISHLEIAYLFDQSEAFDNTDLIKNDLIQCSIIESENLPPAMKKVFQLLYIEGFKTTEIAEKLKLSIHTVRNQKTTAIKKVREGLLKKGLISWLF
jgi:RNA polymerase sigma-70 factor (family 1)